MILWRCIRRDYEYTLVIVNVDFYRMQLAHGVTLWPPADSNLYGFKKFVWPRILGAKSRKYLEKVWANPQTALKI